MDTIQVQKRDGSLQPFDKNKIVLGLAHAGVLVSEANEIADQVETWAQESAQDGAVKSVDIRDYILDLLQQRDETAAGQYAEYKK